MDSFLNALSYIIPLFQGKIFGVGCGQNHDLTVDGSTLWLAGISNYYRQNVFYYTTTYLRDQFFGDYCNLAINLILNWPNDGTTELDRASKYTLFLSAPFPHLS